jgi:imidazolonepropionase-like amidohydrolase
VLGTDTVDRVNAHWEHGVGSDLLWQSPEEVRRRVRDYVERSALDFVKYAASAHGNALITFSEPVQRAIVEEGHRAGMTVQAHTTSVESLRMEIEAGADLLQHGDITGLEPMPDETLKTIVERRLPVAALLFTRRYHDWMAEHGSARLRNLYNANMDQNDRRLIEAGARLMLTTDGFMSGQRIENHPAFRPLRGAPDRPTKLGESHVLWLQGAIERGMAPMEALLSATRYIAEAYHVADELGTLEPGKHADLVVLDADPLADVENYRRVVAVMKDGAIVDRAALPIRRVLTEPAPASQSAPSRS